jgi:hypothetical protein
MVSKWYLNGNGMECEGAVWVPLRIAVIARKNYGSKFEDKPNLIDGLSGRNSVR